MSDSTIVAGVDFGTLSVRVCLYDRLRGVLARAVAEYPLLRSASDPDFATQRHEDQMGALVSAMRQAILLAGTLPVALGGLLPALRALRRSALSSVTQTQDTQ